MQCVHRQEAFLYIGMRVARIGHKAKKTLRASELAFGYHGSPASCVSFRSLWFLVSRFRFIHPFTNVAKLVWHCLVWFLRSFFFSLSLSLSHLSPYRFVSDFVLRTERHTHIRTHALSEHDRETGLQSREMNSVTGDEMDGAGCKANEFLTHLGARHGDAYTSCVTKLTT